MKIAIALCVLPFFPLQNKPKDNKQKPAPQAASAPAATMEWFDGNLTEAKAAAVARNAPLMIAFFNDPEGNTNGVNHGLATGKDFIQTSSSCVNVLALDALHEQTQDKAGKSACKVYPGLTCERHKALAGEVFKIYNEKGEIQTPMYVFLTPQGEEFRRYVDTFSEGELIEAIQGIKKKCGKGVSAADFTAVNTKVSEAERQMALRDYSTAYKLYQEVVGKIEGGPVFDKAKKALGEIDARGKTAVDEVVDLKNKGSFLEAARLTDIQLAKFAGSPTEASLKKEKAKLYADPKAKPTLAPYEMWVKAKELEGKGKKAEAQKIYKTLAEKYPDTEEGKDAKTKSE